MLKITLVTTLISLLITSVLNAEVSTIIKSSGKGSYFYEEHHPMKYDFGNFTLCAGKPSKNYGSNSELSEVKDTSNIGNRTLFNSIDGRKSKLNQILNQTIDWDNYFDKENYSFHVQFKKTLGQGHTLHHRNTCNTRTWMYRVDSATSDVVASVNLVIPENVWVVEIKNIISKNDSINTLFKAKKVYQKPLNLSSKMIAIEQFEMKHVHNLFYVKPGEEIKLEVSFKDGGQNIDLITDLEVTFFGSNRCESIVNTYFKSDLSLEGQNFDVSALIANLKGSFSSMNGELDSDSRNGLLFLGCLTSKPIIQKLLYQNSVTALRDLLSGISDFSLKSSMRTRHINEAQDSHFIGFLDSIEKMARYAVASSLLESMRPMCLEYPLVVNNTQVGTMTAYVFVRQLLDKTRTLLDIQDSGSLQMADYLVSFAKRFSQLENRSYKNIRLQKKKEVIALNADYKLNNKILVIRRIKSFYELFPKIPVNRDFVNYRRSLNEFESLVLDFNYEFHRQVELIIEGSEKVPDFSQFVAISNKLEIKGRELGRFFLSFYEIFDGHYAKQFAETLHLINEQHQIPSKNWINTSYDGFFKEFTSFYLDSTDDAEDKNFEDLSQCFREPIKVTK